MIKFLHSFDYEPLTLSPKVNKQNGFSTAFGGFITILIGLLSILAFFGFGKDIYNKTNPTVLTSENFLSHPILKKENIKVAFAPIFINPREIPNFNRHIDMKIIISDSDGTRKGNETFYTITTPKRCNETDYYEDSKNNITNFYNSPEKLYYCFDTKDSLFPDLKGYFGDSQYVFWSLVFDYCQNSTLNNNHCFPREKTMSFLSTFFMQLVVSNNYFDPNDYENPVKSSYFTQILQLSSVTSRRDIFYFQLVDILSDSGIILESTSLISSYQIDKQNTDYFYNPSTNRILWFIFSLQKEKVSIQRIYVKIQSVAANIGGFIKFFIVILLFIKNLYSKVYFFDYLHEYFNKESIKTVDKCKENNKLNQLQKEIICSEPSKVKFNNLIKIEIQLDKLKETKLQIENMKNNKSLQINLIDVIKFYLCCRRCKSKQSKVLNEINDYFNDCYQIEKIIFNTEYNEMCLKKQSDSNFTLEMLLNKSIVQKMTKIQIDN